MIIGVTNISFAQELKWHDPQKSSINPIEGQAWHGEARSNFYNRMPNRFEEQVRKPLWDLSTNCAGESILFRTNSDKVTVKYTTTNSQHSMPHMPSTGMSGVDLYRLDPHGQWQRVVGRYNFGEQVTYNYTTLNDQLEPNNNGAVYRLYLPLYNGVERLEIGAEEGSAFEFMSPSTSQPIVVYGTSIAQGACASRPAMAWSSILARQLNTPLLNYGFSGNGKLEESLIDMICEIDAKIYILDCMPNLQHTDHQQLIELIYNAVKKIRHQRPSTPIILTDHLGYSNSEVKNSQRALVENCLTAQKEAYERLLRENVEGLHYLDFEQLAMPTSAIVDYVHPSDYGMVIYAEAYNKIIVSILE